MNNITFGDEKFGHYETVAGGAGAVSKIVFWPQGKKTCLWGLQEDIPLRCNLSYRD